MPIKERIKSLQKIRRLLLDLIADLIDDYEDIGFAQGVAEDQEWCELLADYSKKFASYDKDDLATMAHLNEVSYEATDTCITLVEGVLENFKQIEKMLNREEGQNE